MNFKNLLSIAFATLAATAIASDHRAPETPTAINVPDGNKVHFHANAVGVQIYHWTLSGWVFDAPEAVLFDNDGNVVGIHYVGPTWETSSGSFVRGAKKASATVDSTAIPWLLLQGVLSDGPGVLDGTTWIQRVNTVGGIAPSTPGTTVGEIARIPYTAEYYFYRAEN